MVALGERKGGGGRERKEKGGREREGEKREEKRDRDEYDTTTPPNPPALSPLVPSFPHPPPKAAVMR